MSVDAAGFNARSSRRLASSLHFRQFPTSYLAQLPAGVPRNPLTLKLEILQANGIQAFSTSHLVCQLGPPTVWRPFPDRSRTVAQPLLRPVGKDVDDFAGAVHLLRSLPKDGLEQLRVRAQESVLEQFGQTQEREELLGEDVVFSDIEPGLAADFLLVAAGLRHVPEVAVREQAKLIVVVENDPPGSGDPKILEEQVSRKSVGSSQIPKALAVVDDRRAGDAFAHLPNEEVQRHYPALGIEMANVHLACVGADVLSAG